MIKDLVSIITPCYNGEKTVARLMDSVLNQTYKNIEFILINDGSTDNTESIVKAYEQKFTQQGMLFKYVYQENQGLGGAVNTGLKHFTGEFLCWPDSDDYLEPNSVFERLQFLKEHSEYAMVTSDAFIRNSDSLDTYKALVSKGKEHLTEPRQFANLLKEDGIFCSGCHMVRAKAFLEVNPERSIYPARRGQNWQMLLPLYHKFDTFFLNKPLYNYIDYPVSMSKNKTSLESFLIRYNEHEAILINTLEMIENVQKADLKDYKLFIRRKYAFLKTHTALSFGDYKCFDKEFKIKRQYGIEKRDILDLLRRYIKPINRLLCKRK